VTTTGPPSSTPAQASALPSQQSVVTLTGAWPHVDREARKPTGLAETPTRFQESKELEGRRAALQDFAGETGERVQVDGKFFSLDGSRFSFNGVTYGTFKPRDSDGARFPERNRMHQDFLAMQRAGFTVVRTYTAPPDDLLQMADVCGLKVLAGVFYADWRYLVGTRRRDLRQVKQAARREVRATARRLAGDHRVLGLSLGNEIPADVIRWFGTKRIADVLSGLVDVVRAEDPDQLVTYANYPTAEYLPLESLDFLTFNVFLENQSDYRKYLTRLHHLAGDRPLVLGEVGLHVEDTHDGEARQAETISWQLEAALERGVAGTCAFTWTDEWWVGDAAVEGWHFGLTREDRSPRLALGVAAAANRRQVVDLQPEWPSMTVVICAYNAAPTLDECLRHTCSLNYPRLEILVIDDGSTDATAQIARRHPRARLATIDHAGLSVARNEGYRLAKGDIVAYLDSDAYPTPEWPYFLALAFDTPTVSGAGGPNVPPNDDPLSAHAVARAPGGPVHVLISDDRAEHVPGCNMAFWKNTLIEVGGFDPVYASAGDDVDLCWKVLDAGGEIGFHPAALVWHHRRAGLRPYLKQQRGYGRSEALVEARHPDRFTTTGTARWRGHIYDSFAPTRSRQRIYRGEFGAAAYQSVYQVGGYGVDLAHQLGVPAAVALLLSAPAALVHPLLAVPAVVAAAFLAVLVCVDAHRAQPPRHLPRTAGFRLNVALMHLLQPLVRLWGRQRHRSISWRQLPPLAPLPGPVSRIDRGTLLFPDERPRADFAAAVVAQLRHGGLRLLAPSGWEDHDSRILASGLVYGDLLTTAHPEGAVQLRIRRGVHWRRAVTAMAAVVAVTLISVPLSVVALGAVAGVTIVGEARLRRAISGLR
jgi:glycosyltransferase involved in cell wall biosynthesis